jgi:hypothetical protein
VELNIEPGQSLGLMIRGGVEYNLGIFITGVDKDSVAERAGLLVSQLTLYQFIKEFLILSDHDKDFDTVISVSGCGQKSWVEKLEIIDVLVQKKSPVGINTINNFL